jgi:hypothetical protein
MLNTDNPNCDHDRYEHYGGEREYDTELEHLAVTLWRRILQHLLPLVAVSAIAVSPVFLKFPLHRWRIGVLGFEPVM